MMRLTPNRMYAWKSFSPIKNFISSAKRGGIFSCIQEAIEMKKLHMLNSYNTLDTVFN